MPALPMKAIGTVRGQCEQHGETGGDDRGHGQHAEDEAHVAVGQPGGDDGTDGQPEEIEQLNGRDEVGPVHRIEMERLLVLQRGQRGEAGDGRGEEGQGEEDAAQHPDLPDRAPGLAERRRGFHRDVDVGRDVVERHWLRLAPTPGSARTARPARAGPVAARRSRRPNSTTTTIGTAKTKNGARQDQMAASPAPRSTPTMAPMLTPERWAEYTLGGPRPGSSRPGASCAWGRSPPAPWTRRPASRRPGRPRWPRPARWRRRRRRARRRGRWARGRCGRPGRRPGGCRPARPHRRWPR